MTDKQMPEVIWYEAESDTYVDSNDSHYAAVLHTGNFTQYVRCDLCEKTIEDKSGLSLETLVEELGETLRIAEDTLAGYSPFTTQIAANGKHPMEVIDPIRKALSKLDAWRAK